MLILVLARLVTIAVVIADPASNQLPDFKNYNTCPIGTMTTRNGAPVDEEDTVALNSPLITNEFFLESLANFVRKEIPARSVHAKGTGAFGYFEVTHNVTDICKANLFSEIGKKTPVAVRFSPATLDKGEADTIRDHIGFAVKFYTEEGNFDLVGLNSPMTLTKDPILFPSIVKSFKRNPETNLKDPKMNWDFLTLRPETIFFMMYLYSDFGTPDGYRHMPGYSVHTIQVYNKHGESFYIKFHLIPCEGIKNLIAEEAAHLRCKDPDYAVRDLFNAIAAGNFPSWSVSIQVLTSEDVKKCEFDPFDVTKVLPLKKYPLRPLGKLVLNKNPKNFFATIEQIKFCPGNLVPGILGGPDKLFKARRLSYRDAAIYRLGVNADKIIVNCPLKSVFSYDRDGSAPVGSNGGKAPNYFPNSYNGPIPYIDEKRPKLLNVIHDTSYNFEQAAEMYLHDMTKGERRRMIKNIANSLGYADKLVQKRAVDIFSAIHPNLGSRIATALADFTGNSECCGCYCDN